jgi:hypothetical protein
VGSRRRSWRMKGGAGRRTGIEQQLLNERYLLNIYIAFKYAITFKLKIFKNLSFFSHG